MTPRTAFLIVWGSILLGLAALFLLVVAVKKLQDWTRARTAARLGLTVLSSPRPFTEEEAGRNTLLRLFNADIRGRPLRGQVDGVETVLFDRHFITKSGFHTSTEYADETVAAFRCFPGQDREFLLEARPPRAWAKAEPGKVTFESHPDFARRYKVSTQQGEALRSALTDGHLAFLEKLAEQERWTIWAGGEWILVYRKERTAGGRRMRAFLEQARAIAAALKG